MEAVLLATLMTTLNVQRPSSNGVEILGSNGLHVVPVVVVTEPD